MAKIENREEGRAVLAAEYALGTLNEAEQAHAEALMRADREFAAEVEKWRSRFDPLLAAVPDIQPAPGVLDAILSVIGEEEATQSGEIIRLRRKVSRLQWTAGAITAI